MTTPIVIAREAIMKIINVSDVLDRSKVSRHHLWALVICALCMIVDGFDVQAMGYVAPALIKEWGIAKEAFGTVFGAGLLGMAVGAIFLAPLADKFGRRPILITAILLLSVSMFATIMADNIRYLIIVRFIAGISLGAIVPNAVSLAGEFSPVKIRITTMMIISSGFIFGGVIGGIISASVIPIFGWQSVFLIGAIAPLALVILMFFKLPESLLFLTVKGKRKGYIVDWLIKLGYKEAISQDTQFITHETKRNGVALIQLFKNNLAIGTVMLWVIIFMNMLANFFLATWLPVLMTEAGHNQSQAVWAGAVFWIGGLVGNLILGWIIDRKGFGVILSVTFVGAIIAIGSIGQLTTNLSLVLMVIGAAGFCILGAQVALNALSAVFYPTEFRSTGAGFALGIGRLGSVFGPLIGAELMRLQWSIPNLFFAFTVPITIALIGVLIFWKFGHLPKNN